MARREQNTPAFDPPEPTLHAPAPVTAPAPLPPSCRWNQVVYLLQGIGNDFFWPPNAPRNWTYAKEVTRAYNDCRNFYGGVRRGYPATNDPLSHWVDEYYGGRKSTRAASNIVFSNGT